MSVAEVATNEPNRGFASGVNNTVLHIDDVHKSFAGLHALSDVDLDVRQGETHAIIGPNGAGKSTLLNVCVGRLKPDRGAVVFDGEILTGKQPHEINQLGVARVFQTPEVFPDLTVLENVMVPALSKAALMTVSPPALRTTSPSLMKLPVWLASTIMSEPPAPRRLKVAPALLVRTALLKARSLELEPSPL